jgi:hypothetical protein
LALAAWADEARHVFDHTKHWDAGLLAEVEFLADVTQGDLLWCCYNNCTSHIGTLEVLDHGDVLV